MIANQTAGVSSSIVVPLVDANGTAVTASAVTWKLFDERGVELFAGAATDFIAGAPSATVNLTEAQTAITSSSEGRELVLYCDTADGEVEVRDYFLIVGQNRLQVMETTFVTYPEALSVASEFVSLTGWAAASIERQRSALIEAYRRLCRVSFRVPGAELSQSNASYAAYGTGTDIPWDVSPSIRISKLSLAEFDALPEPFRRAIKRAQLAEANVLLGGDPVGDKRREGIISETIGESSTFYQSKPFLNLPISRQAYEEVRRYVSIRIKIARS